MYMWDTQNENNIPFAEFILRFTHMHTHTQTNTHIKLTGGVRFISHKYILVFYEALIIYGLVST